MVAADVVASVVPIVLLAKAALPRAVGAAVVVLRPALQLRRRLSEQAFHIRKEVFLGVREQSAAGRKGVVVAYITSALMRVQ